MQANQHFCTDALQSALHNDFRPAWPALIAAVLFTLATAVAAQAPNLGPTLTPAASATKSVGQDGFLKRWLVLEPIRANGLTDRVVQDALKVEYFPNQLSVLPRDGDRVTYEGSPLTWHAVDTANYNVNLFHFARALDKPTSNVLFWGVTVVDCPEEMSGVRLAIGSNAASVWWLNGEEIIGIYGDRQTVIDDGVSKRLTLKKGLNVVRCFVVNAGGATDFCARFLDKDDKPLTTLTINLNDSN
jgi:hypothetical protein